MDLFSEFLITLYKTQHKKAWFGLSVRVDLHIKV